MKEKSAEMLYILTPLNFEPTAAVQTHQQTFKGEVAKTDKTTCCLRLFIVHYYSMATIISERTMTCRLHTNKSKKYNKISYSPPF